MTRTSFSNALALEALADPRKVLDDLDEALHAQYLTTNRNILDSKNPFIKFGQKGAFSLATPTQEESEAEPLQNFFPERHYVPLLEVLATVNRYSNFLDEFQHWQQRHQRARPSPKAFYTEDAVAAKDRLYRALDKAIEDKEALEQHLARRWQDLFGAKCDLLLYDLRRPSRRSTAGAAWLQPRSQTRCPSTHPGTSGNRRRFSVVLRGL